ncbi:hypothetical protein [Micromonospora lutea]|uniref:Uncharacterized protein n=1 Tax=Micromonospora lutea TaxID=419825 RepID=A0ABQ4IU19_9ACTN|nr:hypothetical protein [Micromonospora lutea]GIJ21414.1 hypothetical protein Vlu01_20380 [Micromonospora lutea]
MIVISLALILVAVVLLVFGLAGGSSPLLVVSIGASLLAAVALVVGARQAAGRASVASGAPDSKARGDGREPGIPTQQTSADVDTGDAGWRQPPGSPVAEPGERSSVVDGYDDEPGAEETTAEQAARVVRLAGEVRVVDGRPRYHLDECPHLVGREHEPLPVAEAVELGFTPCAHCTPDTVLLSESERR